MEVFYRVKDYLGIDDPTFHFIMILVTELTLLCLVETLKLIMLFV